MKPLFLLKTAGLFRVMGVVFTVYLLNGCHTSSENKTTSEPIPWETDLYQVNLLRSNFQKYIRTKQWDSLRSLLSPQAIIIPPGSDTWKYIWSKSNAEWPIPYDSIRIFPEETVRLNDSMVYDRGNSEVFYTDSTGIAQTVRNSYLVLLKKENNQWKLFREVASATILQP